MLAALVACSSPLLLRFAHLTALRLPRPNPPQVVLDGSERCSLAYTLAAQAEATIHLLPTLQAAGHDLGPAAHRWAGVEGRDAAVDPYCCRLL